MRCRNCGAEGLPGKRFCAECGKPLPIRCSQCGADTPVNAKFCPDCGIAIGQRSTSESSASSAAKAIRVGLEQGDTSPSVDGERKTVTALFADIKGSMELMEDLDPEDASAIIDPALKLMIDAVQRYGGHIVQSTGDGVFALFGAPVAHEDHPQRALYAALRMHDEIRRYGDRMRAQGQMPLQVRIGANTGEVVVRILQTGAGQAEYTPIGHSTSLAARLQTLATPGSTVISGSTRRLIDGYFQFRGLGKTTIKGVSEPIELFEVTGLGPLRTRLQAAAKRGLTAFIGRDAEMAQMRRALQLAREGYGQIVAAMGEAGVGKSRLFLEFKAVSNPGGLVLEAYSVSYGKASAYLPVIELLRNYFEITADDDDRKRHERILGKVLGLDRTLEDTLPYLYALFGIPEAADSLAQMDPQIRRRRTQEAIKRILLRESINQPLIVIFEDLHWIDGETQALLNLLVDAIASARILLLVNYRPEFRHDWGSRTHYTQLRLDPLGRESATEMLSALLGDELELAPLRRLIADKTEGNPFFVEEIVQALFEQGVLTRNGYVKLMQPLSDIKIPSTIQAVLTSRIDRLPPSEKELLQTLAVTGRRFTLPLILHMTGNSEAEVERMLSDLQSGEFIYEQPAFPDPEYSFKHALTQEVVYNSVLTERRKLLHERAGAAIESLYEGRLDDHLSELARNYQRSSNTDKALEYLQRAGQQALVRSRYTEAIELFTAALKIVKSPPETAERMQQELPLQLGFGSALSVLKGIASPETGQAFERANELCRQFGTNSQVGIVLVGINAFYNGRGELTRAYEAASRLLAMAESQHDASLLVAAHWSIAMDLCFMGEFVTARNHVEDALSIYDPAHMEPLPTINPLPGDVRATLLMLLGLILCFLGYPDQAYTRSGESLALARQLPIPFRLVAGLAFAALIAAVRRSAATALSLVDEAISLGIDHGFQEFLARASVIRGYVLVELDRADDGIAQLQQGIAAVQSSGTKAQQPPSLASLAQAYLKCGRVTEGLQAIAEGLAISENNGERWYDAELFRIKGELLLVLSVDAEPASEERAEDCFRQAIEIAQRQQAKWWELRATVSLARLLMKQNHRAEAHSMLAEVYNWFTEGFDTADLKDAQRLLAELSA